ncbi:MAG: glycosylhydrolase-like jelly roll fold domain-containing protein, partial [Anaerolineae bacterium]
QNVFYQQPWWPENNLIADYFARLSYALSQGQRVVDILVIHPVGSAWTIYRPNYTYEIGQLDGALDDLLMALMQNQRDFHLGDEMSMQPGAPCEACVVAGETGPELHVGQMAYRTVIVPPGTTLAQNTTRLLHEFAAAGGPVLTLEPKPTLIDGRPAGEPVLPETVRTIDLASLPQALDAVLPFDVRVPGRPTIWAHHRRVGEAEVYFLANIDRDAGGPATVELQGAGKLEEWNLETGNVCQLPCQQQDGVTRVTLDFPPVGSHLLVMYRHQVPVMFRKTQARVVSQIALPDRWELSLHGPNAMTLDTAQVRLGDEDWGEPLHILNAHDMIAEAGVGTPFALRFTFDADVQVPPPVYLAVESPERFEIAINEQPVASKDEGWWTDTSFRKLDISAAVRAGRNEVVLSGVFGRDSELESVYVVGDFGVAGRRLREENRFNGQVFDRYAPDFRLTAPPTGARAKDGRAVAVDLTAQGLAFFAGRATLRQTITLPSLDGHTLLELHNLRAALAHVRVNGQQVGTVVWQPHRVDVTAALKAGENVIEIELVGTLRNLLGPHHLNKGDLAWTGPGQFRDKNRWTDDYILVPFGFDGATLMTFA